MVTISDNLNIEFDINQLSDSSNYNQIFMYQNQFNSIKINYIKLLLNNHIQSLTTDILNYSDSNLPLYLNYLLSIFSISFPHIRTHIKLIIQSLKNINKYPIHPMIFQSAFINLIHSSYICYLYLNPNSRIDNNIIERIASIQNEVEIGMSIFINIFKLVDDKYINIENFFGMNNLIQLPISDFNIKFEQIMNDDSLHNESNLTNNLIKLNTIIIHIEHMTEYNMNELLSKINNDITLILDTDSELNINLLTSKFNMDLNILSQINHVYTSAIKSNYSYLKRFEQLSNFNDIDILLHSEKNLIYYWIDYIANINRKIFDKIFKK